MLVSVVLVVVDVFCAPASGVQRMCLKTPQEVFSRITAREYTWATPKQSAAAGAPVEASINDTELDKLLAAGGAGGTTLTALRVVTQSPVVQLTAKQVREQIKLLPDGLLGRGTRLSSACACGVACGEWSWQVGVG
jgi:hypothetical protein